MLLHPYCGHIKLHYLNSCYKIPLNLLAVFWNMTVGLIGLAISYFKLGRS